MRGLEREVNKAAGAAMQRTAVTVRKEADQGIRKGLNLKSSAVKANLRIGRPFGNARLVRDVEASGKPIPLIQYGARETKKGVSFAVARGRGNRKVYQRQGRKGFIGTGKLPGRVFVATAANPPGPRNAPIKQVYGPSIPQYFVVRALQRRMTTVAGERWPIEFKRELEFRRRRGGS